MSSFSLLFLASFSTFSFFLVNKYNYISSLVKIISLGKPKNLSQFCHVLNWLYQSKTAGKHEEPRVKMISLKNRATQNDWISGEFQFVQSCETYWIHTLGLSCSRIAIVTAKFRPKLKPLGYI